jgi:hypothetical protein
MNPRFPIVVWIAVWLALGWARADTVHLKTGETLEGSILRETDTNITVEVELAGGTILSTAIISRDQIAEVVRSTPEQLAQRAMERAYANTRKYQLDPMTSYAPDYYRLVIDGVLLRFLADYPNSPHTNAVEARLHEWVIEQGTVASGKAKYNGIWMRAEEVARLRTEARAHSNTNPDKTTAKTPSPSASGKASASDLAATPTMETATAGTAAQRDVVDQVGGFIRQYWVVGIIAVVVVLWLCVHIFTHD